MKITQFNSKLYLVIYINGAQQKNQFYDERSEGSNQKMKLNVKQEKGITMTALVITVITLLILTNVMIYNTQSSIDISKLTNLYNDIELLRDKVSTY